MDALFNFEKAFDRTIGWVTAQELQELRAKKVAIAGLGGAGGVHLLTLTRLGIGNFHIADLDYFELQNFNRQMGATVNTINRSKVDVLFEMATAINPEVNIQKFPEGLTEKNLDRFLDGVDLYVDGLDFFELDIRAKVFKRCYELNIPAITAAPIGMGVAYLIFIPGKMSFEDYFCFNNLTDEEKRFNFLVGLTPKPVSLKYLVDPAAVNLEEKKGPYTVMACQLCAGIIGTEALKILLHRGPIYAAPYYHLFDAYLGKFYRGKLLWGNKSPIQIIKKFIVKKVMAYRKKKFRKP